MTQIDFRAFGRKNLSLELGVELGSGELFGRSIARSDAGVVILAVEDGGVRHRTGNSCSPVLKAGAEEFAGAVVVRELQHGTESGLVSKHAVVALGDDFIGPPAGGYLRRKLVGFAGLFIEGRGDVIGEGAARLERMRKTGLQHFFADKFAIEEEAVYAEACGHPAG